MAQVPRFLSPSDATDYLRTRGLDLTEDTIRRWCREGQITAIKLPGGSYRVRTDRLDALLGAEIPEVLSAEIQTAAPAA